MRRVHWRETTYASTHVPLHTKRIVLGISLCHFSLSLSLSASNDTSARVARQRWKSTFALQPHTTWYLLVWYVARHTKTRLPLVGATACFAASCYRRRPCPWVARVVYATRRLCASNFEDQPFLRCHHRCSVGAGYAPFACFRSSRHKRVLSFLYRDGLKGDPAGEGAAEKNFICKFRRVY